MIPLYATTTGVASGLTVWCLACGSLVSAAALFLCACLFGGCYLKELRK